jgi:hypothetical protein
MNHKLPLEKDLRLIEKEILARLNVRYVQVFFLAGLGADDLNEGEVCCALVEQGEILYSHLFFKKRGSRLHLQKIDRCDVIKVDCFVQVFHQKNLCIQELRHSDKALTEVYLGFSIPWRIGNRLGHARNGSVSKSRIKLSRGIEVPV